VKIHQKSEKCLGQKSCQGKLFIDTFTFGAVPVFGRIMLTCLLYWHLDIGRSASKIQEDMRYLLQCNFLTL